MSQQQFRIPTLLALVLIAALSVGGFFAYDKVSSLLSSARTTNSIQPGNIQITNITDSSFIVSWETEKPIAATVVHQDGDSESISYDIRDGDSIPKPYLIHYVQVSNLNPETSVPVTINHANEQFHIQEVETAPTISSPSQALPIYGEIETASGAESRGSIIYATFNSDVSWSVFIFNTTSFVIPMASVRTNDLANYYCNVKSCDDSTSLALSIVSEEGKASYTTTLDSARPVSDTIVIGQEIASEVSLSEPTIASASPTIKTTPIVKSAQATPTSTPSPTTKPKADSQDFEVSIFNPKKDARLRFAKPLIRGQGVPGEDVQITLESEIKQIDTVTVNEDGSWLWTPKLSLEPGDHMLTIKTVDANGKRVTLTRSFSISKSGQQVLAAGTPSATLAPSSVPTPSVLVTPTPIIPTITPTPDMPDPATYAPSVLVLIGGFILLILAFAVI